MPEDRDYGAVTLRSRPDEPGTRVEDRFSARLDHRIDDRVDDEERYADEYIQEGAGLGSAIRRFVERYGWRAYALPVLAVVTVAVLVSATGPAHETSAKHSTPAAPPPGGNHSSPASAPPTGSGTTELKADQAGANAQNEVLASDELPAGGPYTTHGEGTFRVLPGSGPVVGSGTLHRYTVDVEDGITGVDLEAYAHLVDKVLDDPRSWAGAHRGVALQRVDSGDADFHVTLVSSMTVRTLCGYELKIETSCYASDSRVVENVARWVRGDVAYIGDLHAYHVYMINHEVGHAIGHGHGHVCLSNGLAPVMMQQTIGLKSVSGKICESNPWPFPPGAKDAPGVEAPDKPQNNPRIPN